MQGMDKKHDDHAWCKVKMTNIKNDFNLTFQKAWCLGHLQCQNEGYDFFLSNNFMKKTWSGEIVHDFKGDYIIPSPPYYKIYNNAPFCVNMCVACM
jgi:hypothetical protein